MGSIPIALRAGLIGALIALGLAIGFVAQQERAATLALANGDLPALSTLPDKLRIALALLLIAIVALGYLIFTAARGVTPGQRAGLPEIAEGAIPPADITAEAIQSGPLLSTEAGQMMSAGGLMRRFCHELNNALNPIQGYAELLTNDERLSDLHRRHVTKITQSATAAVRDIQNFASALNWSARRGRAVRLDEAVSAGAAVAQAAIGAGLTVEALSGGDVQVTASEAEVGQAILHACAAISPLLAERDMKIDIKIDSVVGAAPSGVDDGAGTGRRLEIWSDPFEPERTRIQFGARQASWRYGRVRLECAGHGWPPEPAGRLFSSDLPDDDISCLFMTILGRLLLDLGGVIMVDTRPLHHTHVTMLWPARIASGVAAPLEIDAAGDDLDALIIDTGEAAAEKLSRRLMEFGLHVASTTSAETALELLAEMGPRCRAVMVGDSVDAALAARVADVAPGCRVFFLRAGDGDGAGDADTWPIDPGSETLERLVAHLRGLNLRGAS